MSKRWEEAKESTSPTSAYQAQKAKYFTRISLIHQAPPPPRSSSHPSAPLPIPYSRARHTAPSSHSLPSASIPRSQPMDIPTGRRASSGWLERSWGLAERSFDSPPVEEVDDSRLVWMGRGEGREEEEEEERWTGYGAVVKARMAGFGSGVQEEEDDALVPFPLLPPSYCVDFEL